MTGGPPLWLEKVASFDTETTGVDPLEARIVTACLAHVGVAGMTGIQRWLVNPGVEIPAEASAIHGVTTERARTEGMDPCEAAKQMCDALEDVWAAGNAVIVMNAPYDLTLLQAELKRHGCPPMHCGPVLDPLVIDRALDRYRKGSRKLDAMAATYAVKLDGSHSADQDALTSARVVWAQARRYPKLAERTLDDLQGIQAEWHRTWAVGFQEHCRKANHDAVIDPSWPVKEVR